MERTSYNEQRTSPRIDSADCIGCASCVHACPNRLFAVRRGKALIKELESCETCGSCALTCPMKAVTLPPGWPADTTRLKGGAGHS